MRTAFTLGEWQDAWVAAELMALDKGGFHAPLPERQPKAFFLTRAVVGGRDVWAGTLALG